MLSRQTTGKWGKKQSINKKQQLIQNGKFLLWFFSVIHPFPALVVPLVEVRLCPGAASRFCPDCSGTYPMIQ